MFIKEKCFLLLCQGLEFPGNSGTLNAILPLELTSRGNNSRLKTKPGVPSPRKGGRVGGVSPEQRGPRLRMSPRGSRIPPPSTAGPGSPRAQPPHRWERAQVSFFYRGPSLPPQSDRGYAWAGAVAARLAVRPRSRAPPRA